MFATVLSSLTWGFALLRDPHQRAANHPQKKLRDKEKTKKSSFEELRLYPSHIRFLTRINGTAEAQPCLTEAIDSSQ
jgi:hypothetical protein